MRSTVLLGAQLATNTLAGYALQKVFAYYYGASVDKSIFDIAFAVPTIVMYLSGFGWTHAIMVGLFTRLRNSSVTKLSAAFSTILNLSLALLIIVIAITAWQVDFFSALLAPGFEPTDQESTRRLILWLLPLSLTLGVSSYLSAAAIAWRLPLTQELVLMASRLAVVVWIILHARALPLTEVAIVLVGTSMLAVYIQWRIVTRYTGIRYSLTIDLREQSVRDATHQFGAFMAVAMIAQVSFAFSRRMGTIAGAEVVALLGYASSVIEPIGTIAGRTLAFHFGQPFAALNLGEETSSHNPKAFGRVLLTVFLLSTGLALLIALTSEFLISFLFGGGQFVDSAVREAGAFLRIISAGLPPTVIIWVVLYPLLARSRYAAARAYILGYIAQILFILILFDLLSASAIAWGYVVSLWIQAVIGLFAVRRPSPQST